MDTDFLLLSLAFILIGATGIVLFYGPMNSAGDSCYCLIPSPEPGAAQGTSSIFLVMGLIFLPMGLMKGGLPTFGRGAVPKASPPGGLTPAPVRSGSLAAVGILLTIVGADAILIPGVLVLKSLLAEGLGVAMVTLGVLAVILGLRKPRS